MAVEMKRQMFQAAGKVLIINGYKQYVDAIRAGSPEGVEIIHTSIRQWQDTEDVIKEAAAETTPLVLVSAGPAGKYMIPEIAKQGKVVLDIGDGMGSFWWENGVAPDGRIMNTNGELEERK
jgi:prefoldin subunit 5